MAPLEDDTSEEIVSWVDGQVVTDWAAEIAKRERAIDGYLNDTDPARAEKYGFRSGQNPQLAWSWFRDNPVGFNGVPFVLFKTILDLDPNHENPTLRAIARIWKREAIVPAGSGPRRRQLDVRSHRHRTQPVRLRRRRGAPGRRAPVAAAVRIRVREPALVRAAVGGRDDGLRRTAAGAARLSEHEPADRQAANRRHGGELGDAIGRASGARARWIACSSRARPATSAA